MTGRSREAGQTVVLAAVSLVVLLGFMGLAIDMGYLRYAYRHMRSAADAAALGGAEELLYNNNTGGVVGAGKADAAKNGFSDGVNGVTVNIYSPPNDGPHATVAGYVEATISQSQPTFFMKIFGPNYESVPVSARAVAWEGATNNGCVYALDPTGGNTFVASGGATVTAPNCNIMDNSSSASGFVASGGSCVTALSIGLAYSTDPGWDSKCTKPTLNVVSVSDPLAYLVPPSVGACNSTTPSPTLPLPAACSYSENNGINCNTNGGKLATPTLQPGTYCNGIQTSGNGTTVDFAPGTYVLNGGGLNVSGGSNVIANNVTFYNTASGASDDPSGGNYKPIVVSGGSTTVLTAPTSGSFDGILFFQDRTLPSGDLNQQNTISGGSGTVMTGALYFPTTPLVISGGSALNAFEANAAIVAYTVTVSGGSNVTIGALPTGENPIHKVVLVE